jgi:F0F1-type ATP synthase assembly protein I
MPNNNFKSKKEVKKALRRGSGQVWWQPALIIGFQITGWILGPLLVALFFGQWLDKKYNSNPKFLLICVGVAFVVSNAGMIINTIKTTKDLKNLPLAKKGEEKDGSEPRTTN